MPSLQVISDVLAKEPILLKLHHSQILRLASSNSVSSPWAFSQDYLFFLEYSVKYAGVASDRP